MVDNMFEGLVRRDLMKHLPSGSASGKKGLIAALDVGTAKICCFISRVKEDGSLDVTGVGHQVSRGTRSGSIVDMSAVESSIREVVQVAEDMAGETVETILVAATGCQPHSRTLRVELALGGHEVTEGDLKSIAAQSIRQDLLGPDRQVLHGLTVGYEIDGLRGINDPRGMRGEKLCARVHVVSGAKSSIQNLTNCVGHCHLGVESVIFGGYASGLASLVQDEIDLGTVCVDMGAGVTSISIFQNNAMVHSDAIPVGGWHVTSDIARGLTTSMRNAERLKTLFGSVVPGDSDSQDMIDVPPLGERDASSPNHMPREALAEVVRPRLEETFELIRDRLEEVGFGGSQSMRVVLTGGASQLTGLRELASSILGRQVRLGGPPAVHGLAPSMRGPAFSTCIGLLILAAREGLNEGEDQDQGGRLNRIGYWIRDNF